jgi:hypothetical protein
MLVSTYVYRQKYEDYDVFDDYGNASKSFYINLINAFNKKVTEIEFDERYIHTTATGTVLTGDIVFRTNVIEAYFGSVYAEGFCPTAVNNRPSVQHRTTADFSEDCRQRFIDEKRREGYKVFQVTFDQFYETSFSDLFSDKEFREAKDEVRPLSPLYVETYRPGLIKNIAGYQAKGKNSSPSAKKDNKNKSNNSSNTDAKETDEEIRARINYKMTLAYALEREGDAYYQMGSLFYKDAYNRYKASYQTYPLPSVQNKINNIESMMRAAKAIDQLGKKVDDFVFSMDPDNKTNYTHGFIQYNGIAGKSSQQNSVGKYRVPSDMWFGITGQRLFLSFQARMGYMQTGNIEASVRRTFRGSTSSGQIVDTVLLNNAGLGLGLSGGINIPVKRFQFYGLYGYEFRVGIAGNMISDAFLFKEEKDVNDALPMFQRRIEFGILGLIPKTRLGFGLNYNLLSIRTTSEPTNARLMKINPTTADSDGTNLYYLDAYTQRKLNYGTVGVKFFWMLN